MKWMDKRMIGWNEDMDRWWVHGLVSRWMFEWLRLLGVIEEINGYLYGSVGGWAFMWVDRRKNGEMCRR